MPTGFSLRRRSGQADQECEGCDAEARVFWATSTTSASSIAVTPKCGSEAPMPYTWKHEVQRHSTKTERGRFARPHLNFLFPKTYWLRGLDLNQRPLGYEGKASPSSGRCQPSRYKENKAITAVVSACLGSRR